MKLAIPSNLAASGGCDRAPERRTWLLGLQRNVAACAQRWSLRLDDPYEPGGECSWVAPARDGRGERVVLKVTWRHVEAEHETDALCAWDGRGSVLLIDADPGVDETTAALLLEHCPGMPLSSRPEAEQDAVIAGLLARLWSARVDRSVYRPLADMCGGWAAEFEQRLAEDPSRLDPGLARAGIELLRELSVPAAQDVVLVTDLHAGNVLGAHREPWLVIDPKPYIGDRAYDVLQHMFNCEERLAADPTGLARRMAALADLDEERVMRWLFARCVHGSLDEPGLVDVALAIAPS